MSKNKVKRMEQEQKIKASEQFQLCRWRKALEHLHRVLLDRRHQPQRHVLPDTDLAAVGRGLVARIPTGELPTATRFKYY